MCKSLATASPASAPIGTRNGGMQVMLVELLELASRKLIPVLQCSMIAGSPMANKSMLKLGN